MNACRRDELLIYHCHCRYAANSLTARVADKIYPSRVLPQPRQPTAGSDPREKKIRRTRKGKSMETA